MDDLVSIIIPTYNRAYCIVPTVESALRQTHANVDVIVIDDGSRDETRARILDTFGHDERVRYVYQDNRGAAAARNHGIRLVRGSYVALLDSDDVWMPFKLELQLAVLRAMPGAGMVWSDMEAVGPEGEEVSTRHLRRMYGAYRWFTSDDLFDASLPLAEIAPSLRAVVAGENAHTGEIYSQMIMGNLVHTSTVLMDRRRLAKVGLFNEALRFAGEDYEFHLRTCRVGRVAYIDLPTIVYQVGRTDQLTRPAYAIHMATNFLYTVVPAIHRDRDALRLPERMIREVLAEAYGWRGEALLLAGRSREATQHLARSLRYQPRRARTAGLLAASLLPPGMRREIRRLYRWLKRHASGRASPPSPPGSRS